MSDIKSKTVAQVLDKDTYEAGTVISRISGTITGIFDPKKGGDWEYQSAKLKDDTGEIEISFSKCSQPKSAKGKKVTLTSVDTAHGKQGIKIEDSEYTNKEGVTVKKRLLKITPTCQIQYEGESPSENAGQSAGRNPVSSPTQPQRPSGQRFQGDILNDMADLQEQCFIQVAARMNELTKVMTPHEMMQIVGPMSTSLFIQCERVGLINLWQAGLEKKIAYPPAPKNPADWALCVVPKGQFAGKTLAEVPDADLLKFFSYYNDKEDNGDFAECVYKAVSDRDILPKKKPEPKVPDLDPSEDDDIPF